MQATGPTFWDQPRGGGGEGGRQGDKKMDEGAAREREASRARRHISPPRPRLVPATAVDRGHRYSMAQRIHALALTAEGQTWQEIERKTGMLQRSQRNLKKKAFERGFDPAVDPRIVEFYVEDGAKSGRPREIGEEKEQEVLANDRSDPSGREKSSEILA